MANFKDMPEFICWQDHFKSGWREKLEKKMTEKLLIC